VQNRHINVNFDHDYVSLSLEVAYAGNIGRSMLHICGLIYAAFMPQIFHQILHILPKKFGVF